MAVNLGEVSVALKLEDEDFRAGLEAAKVSLASFASELARLAAPPDGTAARLAGLGADAAAQLAMAGAEAGAALVVNLSEAIAAGAPTAATAAGNVSAAATAAAGNGLRGAASIGRGFSAGLASGISAGHSGVVAAAIRVAKAAAAAARAELAIHSPSKVTRELGECFDLGFIRGVEDMEPDIRRSVRAAVRVEPPAGAGYGVAREAVPAARASGFAVDYEALAEAMGRRPLVLTMDNRRVADIQARETARAQSRRGRSLALGYGKG